MKLASLRSFIMLAELAAYDGYGLDHSAFVKAIAFIDQLEAKLLAIKKVLESVKQGNIDEHGIDASIKVIEELVSGKKITFKELIGGKNE